MHALVCVLSMFYVFYAFPPSIPSACTIFWTFTRDVSSHPWQPYRGTMGWPLCPRLSHPCSLCCILSGDFRFPDQLESSSVHAWACIACRTLTKGCVILPSDAAWGDSSQHQKTFISILPLLGNVSLSGSIICLWNYQLRSIWCGTCVRCSVSEMRDKSRDGPERSCRESTSTKVWWEPRFPDGNLLC